MNISFLDKLKDENVADKDKEAELEKLNVLEPCIVIAHELFDALPIQQFTYCKGKGWCEKVVNLVKSGVSLVSSPE